LLWVPSDLLKQLLALSSLFLRFPFDFQNEEPVYSKNCMVKKGRVLAVEWERNFVINFIQAGFTETASSTFINTIFLQLNSCVRQFINLGLSSNNIGARRMI
jgi:hypothetical protein